MNFLQKITLLTLSFGLISCACHNSDITELEVIKPQDKYLNCAKLKIEILRANFEINANESRMQVFYSYAQNPSCIANTAFQLDRAQNKALNRSIYLQMLAREKGCTF